MSVRDQFIKRYGLSGELGDDDKKKLRAITTWLNRNGYTYKSAKSQQLDKMIADWENKHDKPKKRFVSASAQISEEEKKTWEYHAESRGQSLNRMIQELVRQSIKMSEKNLEHPNDD